jgi:hypothetical protein
VSKIVLSRVVSLSSIAEKEIPSGQLKHLVSIEFLLRIQDRRYGCRTSQEYFTVTKNNK